MSKLSGLRFSNVSWNDPDDFIGFCCDEDDDEEEVCGRLRMGRDGRGRSSEWRFSDFARRVSEVEGGELEEEEEDDDDEEDEEEEDDEADEIDGGRAVAVEGPTGGGTGAAD